MADKDTTTQTNPMLAMYGACMQMGADLMSFGAKRLEKDMAFQQTLMQAKPQEIPQLQMEFWKSVIEDYQEEAGKMVDKAQQAAKTK